MRRGPIGCDELTSSHHDARNLWPGSNRDKYEATQEAIEVFEQARKKCCVFGSLAFKLLGIYCKPNDVDIIVLDTKRSIKDLQMLLVNEHSGGRFYLMPARKLKDKHWVPYYATHRGARVKVDILQPGEMGIPKFSSSLITQETPPGRAGLGFNDIPVAPLELVLLLKLHGWEEHFTTNLPHYHQKEPEDVRQIRALLIRYKRRFDFDYLPYHYIDTAEERVERYVQEYPRSIGSWILLGLYH